MSGPPNYRPFAPVHVEYINVAMLWWWTLIVGTYQNLFNSAEAYSLMSKVMPEFGWGIFLSFLDLTAVVSLFKGYKRGRKLVMILSLIFWLSVAISFVAANPRSTGWGTYSIISAACVWVFVRLDDE